MRRKQWTLLRQVLPASHILFGSDFSYFAMASSVGHFSSLQLDEEVRRPSAAGMPPRSFAVSTATMGKRIEWKIMKRV